MAYTGIPHDDLSSDSISLVLVHHDEAWTDGGDKSGNSNMGVKDKGMKGLTDEIDRIQLSTEKIRGKFFFVSFSGTESNFLQLPVFAITRANFVIKLQSVEYQTTNTVQYRRK